MNQFFESLVHHLTTWTVPYSYPGLGIFPAITDCRTMHRYHGLSLTQSNCLVYPCWVFIPLEGVFSFQFMSQGSVKYPYPPSELCLILVCRLYNMWLHADTHRLVPWGGSVPLFLLSLWGVYNRLCLCGASLSGFQLWLAMFSSSWFSPGSPCLPAFLAGLCQWSLGAPQTRLAPGPL